MRLFLSLVILSIITPCTFAQNFELPPIFISGEEKIPYSDPYETQLITLEKENAVDAQKIDTPNHSANLDAAVGNDERWRIGGEYNLSIEAIFLSLDAEVEQKRGSIRHDNYLNRKFFASLHYQLNEEISYITEYQKRHDNLDLPGPNDAFTHQRRTDEFDSFLFGFERFSGDQLTKIHFATQKENYDENFAKITTFRQYLGNFTHQWDLASIEMQITDDKVSNNNSDEVTGYMHAGLSDNTETWGYEVYAGVFEGSHSAAKLIGSANIEYYINQQSTIRLNMSSERGRIKNEDIYYRDNSTLVRDKLLPVNHLRKIELSWIWTKLEYMQWTIGIFTSTESDYLYYDYDKNSQLYTPDTIGDVDLAGTNFDFSLNVLDPITIDVKYTYEHLHNLVADFTQLPLHPNHKLNIDFGYKNDKFEAYLTQNFVGERRAFKDQSTTLSSYQVWSLHLQTKIWRKIDAYLDFKNIFDTDYYERAYYKNEGQIVWLGFKSNF